MSGNIFAVVKGVNKLIVSVQLLKSRWGIYVNMAPATGKGIAITYSSTTSTFIPTDIRLWHVSTCSLEKFIYQKCPKGIQYLGLSKAGKGSDLESPRQY